MRHRRLLFRGLLLAQEPAANPCAVVWDFFCPLCGELWASVDDGGDPHSPCTALCDRHPERSSGYYCTYAQHPVLTIPGSLFQSFRWWGRDEALGRLLLAHPLLAQHEARIHANALVAL